jgi:hypothetical protein
MQETQPQMMSSVAGNTTFLLAPSTSRPGCYLCSPDSVASLSVVGVFGFRWKSPHPKHLFSCPKHTALHYAAPIRAA